ncbi:hypothetical protein HK104_011218 [Borealophlyctis nickersoniae]|nr:hypothetical protein HK104_011218 [Borealophlyctis nickersoniae]
MLKNSTCAGNCKTSDIFTPGTCQPIDGGGSRLYGKCDIPRAFTILNDLPLLPSANSTVNSTGASPSESSASASSSGNVPVIVGAATVVGVLGVIAIATAAVLLARRQRYQAKMYHNSTAAVVPEYVREGELEYVGDVKPEYVVRGQSEYVGDVKPEFVLR